MPTSARKKDAPSEFPISEPLLTEMSETFQCFAAPTRLRIIAALLGGERCVGELAELLGFSQPAVSHHLKALRQVRLIKSSRAGKSVIYSLDDAHIRRLFDLCKKHVLEEHRS